MVFDGEFTSAQKLNIDNNIGANIITCMSMSKTYSMTGWRIGYAFGNKKIIKAMTKIQGQATSCANSISQSASVEALNGDQSAVEVMKNKFKERRNLMVSLLNEIPRTQCDLPGGAFYAFPDFSYYLGKSFNNVKIKNDNFLSFEGDGKMILEKTLDITRIGLAAEMLGNIQEAFEITVNYLKEREQFGVKIGSFQALQHRCALMFGEIELCKSIVLKALQVIDSNDSSLSKYSSLAKAKLGSILQLVSNEAVQMHGGIGVTDDADIGFFLKRARVVQSMLGDSNFHLDKLAKIKNY